MSRPDVSPASAMIDTLGLEPNPLGGWFRRIHEVGAPDGGRQLASVIQLLLEASGPTVPFTRMSADAVHYFHQGAPLAVVTVDPSGVVERRILGSDLAAGQELMVVVPGGHWKALELVSGPWSLVSEAVAPGWVAGDGETATGPLAAELDALGREAPVGRPVTTDPPEVRPDRRGGPEAPDLSGLPERLGLEPNLEGGFYRKSFETATGVITEAGHRPLLSTIYYLLTPESPIGHLHLNRSDITHYHHLGGPATYLMVDPDGDLTSVVLGADVAAGQVVSFTCPGGWWKASHVLAPGATACLISETVSPGFHYDDHRMATVDGFGREHPTLVGQLRAYIATD